MVFSNDPKNPRITLTLKGTIKSIFNLQPSAVVALRGEAGHVPPQTVDITGNAGPFQIKKLESNLNQKITYRLKTIKPGRHYRLTVANKAGPGNYGGMIKLDTDQARKPFITILVFGSIEGAVTVQPQAVMVGKLSSNQLPQTARVIVRSYSGKSFHITRLTYDKRLLAVTENPLPEGKGFSLEISPNLKHIPAGTRRKQTLLGIETDAGTGKNLEVRVYLINLSPAAR